MTMRSPKSMRDARLTHAIEKRVFVSAGRYWYCTRCEQKISKNALARHAHLTSNKHRKYGQDGE